MSIISLLTAFGLGSIVTALVQAWLKNRSEHNVRSFQEKQAAYIGLLEAYHQAAIKPSQEAAKNFAYWQMRCELVAPERVRAAIQSIVDTNDDRKGRDLAHEELKCAMREDLNLVG